MKIYVVVYSYEDSTCEIYVHNQFKNAFKTKEEAIDYILKFKEINEPDKHVIDEEDFEWMQPRWNEDMTSYEYTSEAWGYVTLKIIEMEL